MAGWYHQLNGHEFKQASGVVDGQGGLECCSPWGHKESDTLSDRTEMIHFPLQSRIVRVSSTLQFCRSADVLF